MATRRNVASSSRSGFDTAADLPPNSTIIDTSGPSDTTPAVPARVIYKLLLFTGLMVLGPISVYFLCAKVLLAGVHNGNVWAGAAAALAANVVLVAYIISSVYEADDEGDGGKGKGVEKRVGKKVL